ncbi:MAG: GNAT family N-acetyltransferase [Magnetovibrio sp.]|nr:GNAT family N-acetyltransferase [Magnetovibrio sp.]
MTTTDATAPVRWARPDDADAIVRMIEGLAAYENEPPESVKTTAADLLRDGFGERPRFECLIAEHDGDAVGFALFFPNYSTWEGRAGIYVEDLFVEERARGFGLGRALMAAIAGLARDRGCVRIDLAVLDWNPTRDFYHAIDCRHMSEWLPYRMDAAAIKAMAAKAPAVE